MILCFKFKKGEMIVYCIWEEDNVGYYSELALDDCNGKLYLSHLGKKGNEYLSHPTKPL